MNSIRKYLYVFCISLLLALGFAPFHWSGLAILSVSLFYCALLNSSLKNAFLSGFIYGLGFFGFGVSWIFVSIHNYGQLNIVLSALITLVFIMYLALYPAMVAAVFRLLKKDKLNISNAILFSSLWCLAEWARAHFITGFPWLNLAASQMDSPLRYLLPITGAYGLSLITCFSATLLAHGLKTHALVRATYYGIFVLLVLLPYCLKDRADISLSKAPLTVSIIQSNISMHDKWDESVFWNSLMTYSQQIDKVLGTQLIVLPESAIPLPENYLIDYLSQLDAKTKAAKSALVLGILRPLDSEESLFYNSIIVRGNGEGVYAKRHLVPFGEFIPQFFNRFNKWLALPDPGLAVGQENPPTLKVAGFPVASLICYEVAYPQLVRSQLPQAQWIISVNDNGWFGHSFASFQHLQLAQMLALQTGRYHVVANNNGLSSIINTDGEIISSLKPFSAGIIKSKIFRAFGTTPWVLYGDAPSMYLCCLLLILTATREPSRIALLLQRARGAILSTSQDS